ncbi:hypothetical protein EDB81DRAFT_817876 [Dactylonectria macrodidyma]|uniref:Uncharacterized protein n=1 Tax=Dactylonectria macrodidyma TaxID=307937 RepID=A0A9P9DFV7_9HYPO|nr:hypothetical protein EDB81DRAFT_817876 [Dactylonectria macrodidyma]
MSSDKVFSYCSWFADIREILEEIQSEKRREVVSWLLAAAKGLTAAMCLMRLKMLSPQTARQLFTAKVAPTMDYASP